jgi:hypothetical protein
MFLTELNVNLSKLNRALRIFNVVVYGNGDPETSLLSETIKIKLPPVYKIFSVNIYAEQDYIVKINMEWRDVIYFIVDQGFCAPYDLVRCDLEYYKSKYDVYLVEEYNNDGEMTICRHEEEPKTWVQKFAEHHVATYNESDSDNSEMDTRVTPSNRDQTTQRGHRH